MGETYEFAETVFAGDRSGKQTSTIVFLHGLGDTGHGWADNLDSLGERLRLCSPNIRVPSLLYASPAACSLATSTEEEQTPGGRQACPKPKCCARPHPRGRCG